MRVRRHGRAGGGSRRRSKSGWLDWLGNGRRRFFNRSRQCGGHCFGRQRNDRLAFRLQTIDVRQQGRAGFLQRARSELVQYTRNFSGGSLQGANLMGRTLQLAMQALHGVFGSTRKDGEAFKPHRGRRARQRVRAGNGAFRHRLVGMAGPSVQLFHQAA